MEHNSSMPSVFYSTSFHSAWELKKKNEHRMSVPRHIVRGRLVGQTTYRLVVSWNWVVIEDRGSKGRESRS